MLKTFDGLYFRRPYRIFALCTDEVPYNVLDSTTTARTLFCYHYIFESSRVGSPQFWLYRGLSKTLASDDDTRSRLNRRVLVSVSRGTAPAADLFMLRERDLINLFRG